MKFIGIIPARYESTRFPGKPLIDIHGKSMIQRVYEQCLKANLDRVIVATDDHRIFEQVEKFGGEVMMTSNTHRSGTDRIAEAAKTLNLSDETIVINIQGDEPFINPKDIELLERCFKNNQTQIATLVKKIKTLETLNNPNCPKVILGVGQQALYFSREAIPHIKGIDKKNWLSERTFFQHIGIYAFRYDILQEITRLSNSPLEESEGLEQLRWIENGYMIQTAESNSECVAVDDPEDLKRINKKFFS